MTTAPTSKYVSASRPKTSTAADQPNAASVPIEISVSIVAARCRAFSAAARWNGQPAQSTTGAARASATHSQPSNISSGTIETSASGTLSVTATRSRRCRRRSAASASPRRAAGSDAEYPIDSTARDQGDHVRTRRVVRDRHLLGRVVHCRSNALETIQLALDARRTRGARHPTDVEVDALRCRRRAHAATS